MFSNSSFVRESRRAALMFAVSVLMSKEGVCLTGELQACKCICEVRSSCRDEMAPGDGCCTFSVTQDS